MVRAISRLKTVDLSRTRLTPAQTTAIFSLVAERTSLTLREARLDRSDVMLVSEALRLKAEENSSVLLDYSESL